MNIVSPPTHHGPLDHPQFDLTAPDAMARVIHTVQTHQLHAVINCAAWTDVDGAETDQARAARLNDTTVGDLAKACAETGATLVHYSTDYVFAGQSSRPYRTDDPIDPINVYGQTKAAGERHLFNTPDLDYRLIRTSWLYAPWGKNFVRTMLHLTSQKNHLRVVDDQLGRPTSAEHLAKASLALLGQGASGTYHVTDGGECTWCELTRFIVEQSGGSCEVQPCATDEFPRPARRPAYSVLDISGTEKLLGPVPHWRQNVAAVLEQLEVAGI